MRAQVGWIVLALALGAAQRVLAQEESGRILGRVVTEGGIPASGVRVEAEGVNVLGSRHEVTDANGYYRVPSLPVGSYRLRLSLIGYQPVAIDSVTVRLGRTSTVDVTLESKAYELGEILVKAAPAVVDMSSAATATNLAAEQFRNLPTDRNFRSIVSLAPQANLSFLPQDEVNIAGGTGPENAYFLDGVNITDPFIGSTSSNLPYNFVRESPGQGRRVRGRVWQGHGRHHQRHHTLGRGPVQRRVVRLFHRQWSVGVTPVRAGDSRGESLFRLRLRWQPRRADRERTGVVLRGLQSQFPTAAGGATRDRGAGREAHSASLRNEGHLAGGAAERCDPHVPRRPRHAPSRAARSGALPDAAQPGPCH